MRIEKKVLVVDDDRNLLAAMERRLGRRFDITTIESGEKALNFLASGSRFAVVVCDQKMPKMSGLELLKQFREIAPDTVRIMLTGYGDMETVIQAVNDGQLFKFFAKPIETEELAAAIEAGMQHYRLSAAQRTLHEYLHETGIQADAVADEVVRGLQYAAQKLRNQAADVLDELNRTASIETQEVISFRDSPIPLIFTDFDQRSRDNIRAIIFELGEAPDILAKIDMIRLGKVSEYLCDILINSDHLPCVLDVHFSTTYFYNQASAYRQICQSLMEKIRKRIVLRVVDVPSDLRPVRTTDLVNRIRPYCRFVCAGFSGIDYQSLEMTGSNYPVVSVDCKGLLAASGSDHELARRFISDFNRSGIQVIVDSVQETDDLAQLRHIGAAGAVLRF